MKARKDDFYSKWKWWPELVVSGCEISEKHFSAKKRKESGELFDIWWEKLEMLLQILEM